jgi:hypothetical protein
MLLVAAVFIAVHFVHLKADFPNHSLWADWSKYTDEGWYSDAAIRQIQLGHWDLPGDFNPGAALPVWPALELAVFRATGVSLAAARALAVAAFGLGLVCCYLLMRRWLIGLGEVSLAPALAVLLLAVSPMCFAFSRLAILEPLLVLLTLAALLAASAAGKASAQADQSSRGRLNRRSVAWAVALGLLLPLVVLTKTTGLFLLPAVFWMLWAATGYRVRPFLRVGLVAGGVGAAVWGGYFGLFVRPHYLADYRYLFDANAFTAITRNTFWPVLENGVLDLHWMGETLFVLALAAVIGSLAGLVTRRRRGNPLVESLLIWTFGYAAIVAYHANLSPRYYVTLAVPLTMLVAIFFEPLVARAFSRRAQSGSPPAAGVGDLRRRLPAVAAGALLAFVVFSGASQTIYFVLHPEYTFLDAAEQVRQAVALERAADPAHSELVLSISGAQLSLMTGLESICDDYGTMELRERVAAYKPGWFATWNFVEDDKMDALAPTYRLVRVGAFPALDDPERNLLILYRLDPIGGLGVDEQPKPVEVGH